MITDNQSIDLSDFVNGRNRLTFRAKHQLIDGCRSLSNSPRKMSTENEHKRFLPLFKIIGCVASYIFILFGLDSMFPQNTSRFMNKILQNFSQFLQNTNFIFFSFFGKAIPLQFAKEEQL